MEVVKRKQPSQIKIEAIEYEGKPRIDVRLWVFAKELEKMIPTRRDPYGLINWRPLEANWWPLRGR